MTRHLVAPAVGAGVLMALYLLTRPYGDVGGPDAQAAALASPWWLFSHVCGMLALASAARLALRMHDIAPRPLTAVGRWTGLAGMVLVLPYYGAEAFALHVLGQRAATGDMSLLPLVEEIRSGSVAMSLFGLGLVLLAVAGATAAIAWRSVGSPRWAAWPLGLVIAGMLPQFFLPPAGRMAYGVVALVAGMILAVAAWRRGTDQGAPDPRSTAGSTPLQRVS